MNRLRLSGSARPDTCSADTVVPRMTNRSTPASTTCFQYCWVRWGDRAPATVTPARRISCRRSVISSGMIGAAYSSCIRGTTVSAEHVSGRAEPLNLKRFIYELDVPVIVGGASTYTAALHLSL